MDARLKRRKDDNSNVVSGACEATPKMGTLVTDSPTDLGGIELQYPLVNAYIFIGKTHYFDWAIFNSYVTLCNIM